MYPLTVCGIKATQTVLFRFGFDAGLVVDGIEEPRLPAVTRPKAQARWREMPEIPPILVVRMRRAPDVGASQT